MTLHVDVFGTTTIAMFAFFLGYAIIMRSAPLRDYGIPELVEKMDAGNRVDQPSGGDRQAAGRTAGRAAEAAAERQRPIVQVLSAYHNNVHDECAI